MGNAKKFVSTDPYQMQKLDKGSGHETKYVAHLLDNWTVWGNPA